MGTGAYNTHDPERAVGAAAGAEGVEKKLIVFLFIL